MPKTTVSGAKAFNKWWRESVGEWLKDTYKQEFVKSIFLEGYRAARADSKIQVDRILLDGRTALKGKSNA